jgi:hypothetical protein
MAVTSAFCNSYKLELLSGLHASNSSYKIALYTGATQDSTTTRYTTLAEVVGSLYTAGGQVLNTIAFGQDVATSWIDWTVDPSWPTSTISAQSCMVYDDTHAGKAALAVFDFGGTIASSNGTFTVTFPAAAAATALLRIA